MDLASWRPQREIPDHWFPTNYSRKKGNEHLTEVVTAHLAADRPHPTDLLRSEYHLRDNPRLRELLESRLGPALSIALVPEDVPMDVAEPQVDGSSGISFLGL